MYLRQIPTQIAVLISSFPYAINWSQANVPAILHITHAAQEQGTAIANVLFGDYDPAGRLVQTWPTGLHQLPGCRTITSGTDEPICILKTNHSIPLESD